MKRCSSSSSITDSSSLAQNTKVTIVHSGTQLLNDVYPDKFRRSMEQKVRSRGINLVDQDYVEVFPEPLQKVDLVTRKGKTINGVDLVVRTFLFNDVGLCADAVSDPGVWIPPEQ